MDYHTHAGLQLVDRAGKHGVQILSCLTGTKAANLPWWQLLLCHKYIDKINGERVHTCQDVATSLQHLRSTGATHFTLTLATDASDLPSISQHGVPQIYFDQLSGVHGHLSSIIPNHNDSGASSVNALNGILQDYNQPVSDPTVAPTLRGDQIMHIHNILSNTTSPYPTDAPRLTTSPPEEPYVAKTSGDPKKLRRKDLVNADDWGEWEKAEWLQLNQYCHQNLFGETCAPSRDCGIFNLVW